MKPRVVMHRLKIMDKDWKVLEEVGPYPAVEIKDIIFIKAPNDSINAMKKEFVDAVSASALATQKTFIILPPEAELLEVSETWEPIQDVPKNIPPRRGNN